MPTKKELALLRKHGLSKLDKPKRTPKHKTKSHAVLTKIDGKAKLIRFGAQGADTAKGKSSPAWWSAKFKW